MIDRRLVFEEILQVGGTVAAKPAGCSMYPVIAAGDRILVSPPADLKRGDIVLYRSGEVKICHRLVGTFWVDGKKWLRTRGDSSTVADAPVAAEEVVGKVTRIERSRVTRARKALLLAHPFLRFGRLNALVCTVWRGLA